jgi:asparagine synthase (glutamine-hydrolysing)
LRIAGYVDWTRTRRADEALGRFFGPPHDQTVISDEPFVALAARASSDDSLSDEGPILSGRLEHVKLVADARIDNLGTLRSSVGSAQDEPTARILAKAYLKWGESFGDHLVGDFAVVLWDAREQRVVACRDPFGVRPIAYRYSSRGFWFGSDVAQLLKTFESIPALDDDLIVEELVWRYKSHGATFFKEIREIRAGHFLIADASGVRSSRYWFPPAASSVLPEATPRTEVFEEIRRLFRQSVERRLRNTRAAVVQVSGGLDSSSIAIAADQIVTDGSSSKLVGLGIVYPGLDCDESRFIAAVARKVHFPIERWDGTISDPVDLVEPSVLGPDRRTSATADRDGDAALARNIGAHVILSGIGGDDLMMCVGLVRDMIGAREWRDALRVLFVGPGSTVRSRLRRVRFVAGQFLPVPIRRWRARVGATVPPWLVRRLHGYARVPAEDDLASFPFRSFVQRNTWARLRGAHLVVAIGAMQARAMSLGLEYRYPYLDRDLAEFVLNLPPSCLPKTATYARIHREAFGAMLPAEIANGFAKAEYTSAIRNRVCRARVPIDSLLSEGPWRASDYVDRDEARRFWRGAMEHPQTVSGANWWRLWKVAALEAWMRKKNEYYGRPTGG